MSFPGKDTIAAISTAIGPGAIGIVRLSGPGSIPIAEKIFSALDSTPVKNIASHSMKLGYVMDKGTMLDQVLLLLMRAPRSYTRQNMVEIHCHGGHASVRSVLDLVLRQGASLAGPGEFTRLAFEAGRIDLSQAEAVLDIIEARTDAALRSATARLSGRLGEHIGTLKDLLLETLSELEAVVDFPDEELGDIQEQLLSNLKRAEETTRRLADGAHAARLYRNGLSVVIAGKPNVGKSSLFNRLLHRSRAIVTPEPGTTRDLIEETLSIEGVPVRLVDSAGLRKARGEAERHGVELAHQAMEHANLVLAVMDSSCPMETEDQELVEKIHQSKVPALYVLNKIDLPQRLDPGSIPHAPSGMIRTCATSDLGMDKLGQAIAGSLLDKNLAAPEDALIASARESDCIKRVGEHLQGASGAIKAGFDLEAVSIDLRDALSVLGQLLGEVSDEDVLEQIFSRFCIGK